MSHQVCLTQTVGAYAMGLVGTMAHTGCTLRLSFCDGHIIDHYICDIPPLLQLSCTSTYINELVVFVVVGVNVMVPSLTISISYTLILSNILSICSTEGRSKAFSTCNSHIILVSLFFGSSAFIFPKLRMLARNDYLVTEFILAGLTDHPELQQSLFYLFLMIYIVTMCYMLTSVACDRCVAICTPLLCKVTMFHKLGVCPAGVAKNFPDISPILKRIPLFNALFKSCIFVYHCNNLQGSINVLSDLCKRYRSVTLLY
eukprot:bmy_19085T0